MLRFLGRGQPCILNSYWEKSQKWGTKAHNAFFESVVVDPAYFFELRLLTKTIHWRDKSSQTCGWSIAKLICIRCQVFLEIKSASRAYCYANTWFALTCTISIGSRSFCWVLLRRSFRWVDPTIRNTYLDVSDRAQTWFEPTADTKRLGCNIN